MAVDNAERAEKHKRLLAMARQSLPHSYSPYSNFAVAAALVTEDGSVFTGVNVENINYTGTICAERSAFVSAISQGHKQFQTIAIVSSKAEDCWPCGQCRQFMLEFGDQLVVVVAGGGGTVRVKPLGELIPMSVVPASCS